LNARQGAAWKKSTKKELGAPGHPEKTKTGFSGTSKVGKGLSQPLEERGG